MRNDIAGVAVLVAVGFCLGPGWSALVMDHPYHATAVGDSSTAPTSSAAVEPLATLYSINFTESGLPSNTLWYVNCSLLPPYSQSAEAGKYIGYVTDINGPLFSYTAGTTAKGYYSAGGSFVTAQETTHVKVYFYPRSYSVVTFVETGLYEGTVWNVSVGGWGLVTSNSNTIVTGFPAGTYTYTVSSGDRDYAASGGGFVVSGGAVRVTVAFGLDVSATSFAAYGLPSGTTWFVNVTGTRSDSQAVTLRLSGSSSSLSGSLANGSYSYTVATVDKNHEASGGSFNVAGATVSEPVTFSLVTYSVSFTDPPFPSGTEWYVNINGTQTDGQGTTLDLSGTTATVSGSLANGSYTYTVGSRDKNYAASGGPFVVVGTSVSEPVTFNLVVYAVSFRDFFLPTNVQWYVNITGTQTDGQGTGAMLGGTARLLAGTLPNGSYTFRVSTNDKRWGPETYDHALEVNGAAVSVPTLMFTKQTYGVTFTESGLVKESQLNTLAKKGWTVVLNGTKKWSTASTISFGGIVNGTFPVLVTGPSGYTATGSGTVTVKGTTNVAVTITKAKTLTLTFKEKGLKGGPSWCVTLDDYQLCSSKSSQRFMNLTTGTYSYAIGNVTGYAAAVRIGKVSEPLTGPIGLTKSLTMKLTYTTGPSVSLGFAVIAPGGSDTTWYVPLMLQPSSPVASTAFGLKVTAAGGEAQPTSAASAGCTVGAVYLAGTTCTGTPGSWYAVLVNAVGTIVALYAGTTPVWSNSVTITAAMTLNVISGSPYDGQGYTLSAYGTGSTSVTGEVSL